MSFDAGSIAGKIGLDVNPYAQGMMQATSIARLFPGTVSSFLAAPLLGIVDLARSAARAIVGLFSELTDFADSMGDLADSIGVSVETLTALGAAATTAGADTQSVADAFRFLGRNVAEAMEKADSEASRTFSRLGVRFLEADGSARPLEAVFFDMADAIARLSSGAERTSVAMEVFGRGGTQLVPFMRQGSAALKEQVELMGQYGVTVTKAAQESADRWNDTTTRMNLMWRGLQQAMMEPVREALTPQLEAVAGWFETRLPLIRAAVQQTALAVAGEIGAVPDRFETARTLFNIGFDDLVTRAINMGASVAGAISNAAEWAAERGIEMFVWVRDNVFDPAVALGTLVAEQIGGAFAAGWQMAVIAAQPLLDAFELVKSVASTVWEGTIGPMLDVALLALQQIKSILDAIAGALAAVTTDLSTTLRNAGINLVGTVTGVISGTPSAAAPPSAAPPIAVNVTPLDPDRVAQAVANHLAPQTDQQIKDAEAGAKAARFAAATRRNL